MNLENHCLLCHKRKNQVQWLKPIYDWYKPDKLTGYYCEKHYPEVKFHHSQQKEAYEEMVKRMEGK